jgi:transcriptional regulator EpsA
MGGDSIERGARLSARQQLPLNLEESASFLRVAADSLAIKRHYELFLWLNGELQTFLPHEILVAAWGDFATGNLRFDVASSLPGVRTAQLAHCRLDDLVRDAYTQWVDAGRGPLVLSYEDSAIPLLNCNCDLHRAVRRMRFCVVHGVRDRRGGDESLYIALNRENPGNELGALTHLLFSHIDVAFRKVKALPQDDAGRDSLAGSELQNLSAREHEILHLLRLGRTNVDIARELDISPYTVKNHLQRIFRKIGVTNRTQAAAKMNEAAKAARES